MNDIPGHLKGYESLFEKNPRAAALNWFADSGYGLFLHYGLYSLLGRGEWAQYNERIPVAEYAKLKDKFKAEAFDADKIADLAVECGFNYITFTVHHFEGFCMFDAGQTSFNCVTAPCGRDLLGELADACGKRELGLFIYYSHGRDWRHPHAPNNDQWGGKARPEYDPPEPSYAYGNDHNLRIYVNYVYSQVARLMADYKNIAGICFDGIEVPLSGDYELFKCRDLYDLIRQLKPHALISYKQGLLGAEDFTAYEHKPGTDSGKLREVAAAMCPGAWGYLKEGAGKHRSAEEIWNLIQAARHGGYNLLVNTGLLPDGALDAEDEKTLREVGERLKKQSGQPEEPETE